MALAVLEHPQQLSSAAARFNRQNQTAAAFTCSIPSTRARQELHSMFNRQPVVAVDTTKFHERTQHTEQAGKQLSLRLFGSRRAQLKYFITCSQSGAV
jgi:hypothetical protein